MIYDIDRLKLSMVLNLLMKNKFYLIKSGMNMVGEQCQCMMEHSKHVFS